MSFGERVAPDWLVEVNLAWFKRRVLSSPFVIRESGYKRVPRNREMWFWRYGMYHRPFDRESEEGG